MGSVSMLFYRACICFFFTFHCVNSSLIRYLSLPEEHDVLILHVISMSSDWSGALTCQGAAVNEHNTTHI